MEEELISVIVPVYKVEAYLNKCIDSIISQTYKNLEIILVDDGSPDNCPKICDEYAKKDKRIKVIHKKNGGLSDARNNGLRIATGKYIGFVDSDDYIDDGMYEYLYSLIKKYDADISTCGYRNFGEYEYDDLVPKEEMCIDKIEALKKLSEDAIVKNYAWNKLYKKELFIDNNIEYPVGVIMEDVATTYKLFELCNKIVIGNNIFYNYLRRGGGITGEKGKELLRHHIENTLQRFEHFKDDKDLGFCFYKELFYITMRAYLDYDEIVCKYLDDNKIVEKIVTEGKECELFSRLSLADKVRLYLFEKNRKLYKNVMNFMRRVKNTFKYSY